LAAPGVQQLAGSAEEAGVLDQAQAERGALAAHHRQVVPLDPSKGGALVEVRAEGVAQRMVQLLAQRGGLALAQVGGQDDEPERAVVVELLVGDHRRSPSPCRADPTVAEARGACNRRA